MQRNLTILNELKELGSPLAEIAPVNVFSVPDGYFEAFAPAVLLNIHRQESNTPAMEVPAGYFDSLAGNIMNRIKAETAVDQDQDPVFMPELKKINVFTVPDGYFERLANETVSKLDNSETAFLPDLKHKPAFEVPQGYFEQLPATILQKVKAEQQPAKVISMGNRPSVFRYAAAAVVTGILGLTLFNAIFKPARENTSGIETAAVISEGKKIAAEGSFDKELESITDEDIVNYLSDNGHDVNAALVASVTDEQSLPSEEDYIFDDKTLDNFLDELQLTQTKSNRN